MNYYDVFGVSPKASSEEINAAHKALAKKYHPDISDCINAHEKMAKINEANEVLSDTVKREKHDRELRHHQQKRNDREAAQRAAKAEYLRNRSEAKLKAAEAAQQRRTAEAAQRAGQEEQKRKRFESHQRNKKIEADRQLMIDLLSSLVKRGRKQQLEKTDTDEVRQRELQVLLALIRDDVELQRRKTEEEERKQRIEEIMSLLKNGDEKARIK